jgi:hypothetical protein
MLVTGGPESLISWAAILGRDPANRGNGEVPMPGLGIIGKNPIKFV